MSQEAYKSWNIKGIAEDVIKEIREDWEELDNVLDDYLQRVYWSIYSKEPDDARVVVKLVKEFISEIEE